MLSDTVYAVREEACAMNPNSLVRQRHYFTCAADAMTTRSARNLTRGISISTQSRTLRERDMALDSLMVV